MLRGLDRRTGLPIAGDAVILQALDHALSTPVGSYPVARGYGVDIAALIDRPANPETLIDALVATGEAIGRLRHILTGDAIVEFVGLGISAVDADGAGTIRVAVRTPDGLSLTVAP